MRTFLMISAAAALMTLVMSSCGGEAVTEDKEKELVYEGSMAEPQIGSQTVAAAPADSTVVDK